MKLLQAQFSFCHPLMLCTAPASAEISCAMVSAVLIRMWHLHVVIMSTLQIATQIRAGRAKAFLSAFMAVEEALVFICTCSGFSVSADSLNYGDLETGDEKTIKK